MTALATADGRVLNARYQLQARLVSSELSTIYNAIDLGSGELVVIKAAHTYCPDDLDHTPECCALAVEGQMLIRLRKHAVAAPANIAEFHCDGRPHLVMSHIPGGTLEEAVVAGRLARRQLIGVIDSVAAVVEFAHQLGVAHQDIKPSNILLPPGGPAVLIDWGAAATLRPRAQRSRFIAYTPGFASDEQQIGWTLRTNDVYGLGRTLETCCAHPDPHLLGVIRNATAPLGERYPDVAAFRRDLRRAVPELHAVNALRLLPRWLTRMQRAAFR